MATKSEGSLTALSVEPANAKDPIVLTPEGTLQVCPVIPEITELTKWPRSSMRYFPSSEANFPLKEVNAVQ